MKFNVVVCDPPYEFSDKLTMSKTKRGSETQYDVLKDQDITALKVKDICADDCVLALWVPGSKLDVGMECCKAWGFAVTQTWIWVKTKQRPLTSLHKSILKILKKDPGQYKKLISEAINSIDINDILNFFMGRCFRQTHELVLIGTRGKYTKMLKNKSQRSVYIGPALKVHSKKPEELQNRLDIMFSGKKLELFARRDRDGYVCVGDECPSTSGEDIRDSVDRLSKLP